MARHNMVSIPILFILVLLGRIFAAPLPQRGTEIPSTAPHLEDQADPNRLKRYAELGLYETPVQKTQHYSNVHPDARAVPHRPLQATAASYSLGSQPQNSSRITDGTSPQGTKDQQVASDAQQNMALTTRDGHTLNTVGMSAARSLPEAQKSGHASEETVASTAGVAAHPGTVDSSGTPINGGSTFSNQVETRTGDNFGTSVGEASGNAINAGTNPDANLAQRKSLDNAAQEPVSQVQAQSMTGGEKSISGNAEGPVGGSSTAGVGNAQTQNTDGLLAQNNMLTNSAAPSAGSMGAALRTRGVPESDGNQPSGLIQSGITGSMPFGNTIASDIESTTGGTRAVAIAS